MTTSTIGEQVLNQVQEIKNQINAGELQVSEDLLQVLNVLSEKTSEEILKESRKLKKEHLDEYLEYQKLVQTAEKIAEEKEKNPTSYHKVPGIDWRIIATDKEVVRGEFPAMKKIQAIWDEIKGSWEHIENNINNHRTAVFVAQKEKDPDAIQKMKEKGAFKNTMDTNNLRGSNRGKVHFKENTPYLVLVKREHGSPYPVEVVFEQEESYGNRGCYYRDISTEKEAEEIMKEYTIAR